MQGIRAGGQQVVSIERSMTTDPGETTVTWELSEAEVGTTLKLTHAGLDSFPDDDQAFTRESTQAGWDYFVRDSLKAYLEGGSQSE